MCKAKKSDHIHPILETALATSNTSHSIQNVNYLLQFHLGNSPSLSVWSPWALYSSKTITVCIRHMNLCYPSYKHKNIWWNWKIVFLRWPICLEQFASNTPPLILPPLLKLPSRCTCLIIISKLFFTAVPIPLSDASKCVCVCVISVIVKCPVLPSCAVDGCSRNPVLLLLLCIMSWLFFSACDRIRRWDIQAKIKM